MSLPAAISELQAGLSRVKNFSAAASTSSPYIKMGKDGRWTFGSDEIEIEADSEWAVNPQSFSTGFSAFDEAGNRVGEEMRLMTEPPVVLSDLPRVNARWMPQISVQMKCLNGEDEGTEALYCARSRGGLNATTKLLEEVYTRIENSDPLCVPVVQLKTDSYKHKKYGKIYTPELEIVDWIDIGDVNGEEASFEPEPEPEPEPEQPKRRQRRR